MTDPMVAVRAGPPPPHVLILSSHLGSVWRRNIDGDWFSTNPNGTWTATWDELAAGKHGELSMLLPIPWILSGQIPLVDAAALDGAIHGIVEPVGRLMAQLASAAMAGVARVVSEAYRLGEQAAAPAGDDGG